MNLMEKWKKFFCDAGVPASEASTYAYKFSQNRIQTNMLVDLNKDYLKEMGITVMGDVIAILRHSKQVYEEIQKTGKIELPEEKEPVKDKEVQSKPKKQVDRNVIKAESKTPPNVAPVRASVKRKTETTSIPLKKKSFESSQKIIDPNNELNNDNIEECEDLGYVMLDSSKKAILFNQKMSGNVQKQLKILAVEKKPEKTIMDIESNFVRNTSEDEDDDDDHVEVIIKEPIVTPFNGYKKFPIQDKYETVFSAFRTVNMPTDANKRAVFKRLGDDISQHSVSSTTAFDDDEQNAFVTKKMKEETTKISQEKNSVFHRLGQKCDVSSTSMDVFSAEEKRSTLNFDFVEAANKSNTLNKNKVSVNRKVKAVEDPQDPITCLPKCVRSTYSEGILAASSSHDRKLSLKERLGLSRGSPDLIKPITDECVNDYKFRKSYPPSNNCLTKQKSLSTGKKKVSFGSVSEKLIPSREEAIESGELAISSERISVFDRLGFNRSF